tara:strand:- start:210 stop:428 length:219 start_codon:yes stop_codon:yes gene_type:complete
MTFELGDLVHFKVLLRATYKGEWLWRNVIGHITGAEYDFDGLFYYEVTDSRGEQHIVEAEELNLLGGTNAPR